MYENTGPRAHRMAAELNEAGVDVQAIYRRLYENIPQAKLDLLARGLANVERFDGGLLTLTPPDPRRLRGDRRRGDLLRGRRRPPARARGHGRRRARARPARHRPEARRKVSLRASDDRVDVSAIARAHGGGGHRRAAGFSTTLEYPELVEVLRREPRGAALTRRRASSSSTSPRGSPRTTSWRACGGTVGKGVKVGHAGTLDPFATGLLLVLVGRATRVQRFLMALPKSYETVARLGWTSTTGDVDGEIAPGRMPPEPFELPTGRLLQRPPAYSAVKVDGERAYALARAGEAVELAEREVEVYALRAAVARGRPRGVRDRVLVRDLRALAGRRPRRRVLRRAAPHRDRPVRRGEPTRSVVPLDDGAARSCPP